MNLERFREALQALLEAAGIHRNDVHTQFHIAACYEGLEIFPRAVRYYLRVVEQDELYIEAWMGLGFCLEKQEKYLEAVHYYQKALRLDEENEEICLALAICEFKLGNRYAASENLHQALEFAPEDVAIWQAWAELLYDAGEPENAIRFLLEGIQQNPQSSELYYLVSGFSFRSQNVDTALLYLENALLLDYKRHDLVFQTAPEMREHGLVREIVGRYQFQR